MRRLLINLLISMFDPQNTFETFSVHSGNRFAYAAAAKLAELGANIYNPLVLLGESGIGKTHLLNAVGNATCDNLTKKLELSIVTSKADSVIIVKRLQESSGNNLVLIDDFHLLDETLVQSAFWNALTEAVARRTRVVLAARHDSLPVVQLTDCIARQIGQSLSIGMVSRRSL